MGRKRDTGRCGEPRPDLQLPVRRRSLTASEHLWPLTDVKMLLRVALDLIRDGNDAESLRQAAGACGDGWPRSRGCPPALAGPGRPLCTPW